MSYPAITRVLNKVDLMKYAMIRIGRYNSIDLTKYQILSAGIFENAIIDTEGNKADVIQVVVCDKNCNESKVIIKLADLHLTPDEIFNYYLYRFDIKELRRGSAIRVVKEATDTDPDWFAYNGLVVTYNVRQISFVSIQSHGPFHRTITARQAYHHGIKVYVYKDPDDYGIKDNVDLGCQCDLIR